MSKRIIGIDQSLTSTGIVVREEDDNEGILAHFNVGTSPKEYDRDRERIQFIYERIIEICNEYDCKVGVIEAPSFASKGRSTRSLAGLYQVILCMVAINLGNENVFDVPPTSLKLHATGYGKSDKEAMIASLPPKVHEIAMTYNKKKREDFADAYWLTTYPVRS